VSRHKATPRLRIVRAGQSVRSGAAPRPESARVERAFAVMAARTTEARTLAESDRLQLAAVHALVQARSSFLVRLDAAGQHLDVSCTRGRNDARIASCVPGEGPVGGAFGHRRILRENELIVSPLVGPEGPVGCLVLVGARLTLSDDLLNALAAQVVAAAEVARLRDESARRRKDLETAVAGLKGLEKNRDELLAHVSHDLKNPLTTIKTYLTLLERGNLGQLDEKARRAVETCQRNSDRLLRMINDLLLVSRLEGGEMALDERPFGLKALVEEASANLAEAAASARVQLPPVQGSEVFVRGSRARLSEAIFNVLENAVHRTPPEGTVDVGVAVDAAGVARLSVKDPSAGVDPQALEHVFDGFYRSGSGQRMRRLGAELALPVAARVVRLHGGRVSAQTAPGGGSLLEIYLPTFAAAVAPAAMPSAAGDGGAPGGGRQGLPGRAPPGARRGELSGGLRRHALRGDGRARPPASRARAARPAARGRQWDQRPRADPPDAAAREHPGLRDLRRERRRGDHRAARAPRGRAPGEAAAARETAGRGGVVG
jgi:signal transduction histidine kinase